VAPHGHLGRFVAHSDAGSSTGIRSGSRGGRQACASGDVTDDAAAGMMVIELPGKRRIRVDVAALRRVLAALESR
jgi:hypothetical protein